GTSSNVLRKNVDPPASLVIGVSAAVETPAGVWIAGALPPKTANIVFSVFFALVIVRMLVDLVSHRKPSELDDVGAILDSDRTFTRCLVRGKWKWSLLRDRVHQLTLG